MTQSAGWRADESQPHLLPASPGPRFDRADWCASRTPPRAPRSALVEDPLGDLALADLAPLPAARADGLVEVLLGEADGSEPNFRLGIVELGAPGEVEEVRPVLDGPSLRAGLGDRPVEDEANGLESRLGEIVIRLQGADPRLILSGHEWVPVSQTLCGIADYGCQFIANVGIMQGRRRGATARPGCEG